jgi:hypothetical protein
VNCWNRSTFEGIVQINLRKCNAHLSQQVGISIETPHKIMSLTECTEVRICRNWFIITVISNRHLLSSFWFLSFSLSLSDLFYLLTARSEGLLLQLITLSDRHALCRTPPDEGSARRRDLYLYDTQHSRQAPMPPARLDAIPASKWPRGQWDRSFAYYYYYYYYYLLQLSFRPVAVVLILAPTKQTTIKCWLH